MFPFNMKTSKIVHLVSIYLLFNQVFKNLSHISRNITFLAYLKVFIAYITIKTVSQKNQNNVHKQNTFFISFFPPQLPFQ